MLTSTCPFFTVAPSANDTRSTAPATRAVTWTCSNASIVPGDVTTYSTGFTSTFATSTAYCCPRPFPPFPPLALADGAPPVPPDLLEHAATTAIAVGKQKKATSLVRIVIAAP